MIYLLIWSGTGDLKFWRIEVGSYRAKLIEWVGNNF